MMYQQPTPHRLQSPRRVAVGFRIVRAPLVLLACTALLFLMVGLLPTARANVLSDDPVQSALVLDGTGEHLEIGDDPALELNAVDGFTLEAWVYRDPADRCETVIGKDFTSSYWLGFCNDTIRFYTRTGGADDMQDGTTAVPANVWTHIAVTWEAGGQRRYYINGDLDHTGPAGAAPGDNSFPLLIGSNPGTDFAGADFAGQLAEVRLWNVARTQNEIRRTIHVALEEPRPGLAAAWNLTSNVRDSLGTFDATAQNGAAITSAASPAPVLRPQASPIDANFNELPAARALAALAAIPEQNRALIIGGAIDFTFFDTIYAVELDSGASSLLGTLPTNLSEATATYAPERDTVYVFGGSTTSTTRSDAIYAVDPLDGSSTTLSETLPTPRSFVAAAHHPTLQRTYLFGGTDSTGALNDTLVFDPATGTLSEAPALSLPDVRSAAAAVYSSITGDIYLLGGNDGTAISAGILRLRPDASDPLSGTISAVATLPFAVNGIQAVEETHTGLIYVLGNEDSAAFDPLTGQVWRTPLLLPEGRTFAGAAFDPRSSQALLIGGLRSSSARSTIWRLPLGSGPALPLGRWDYPQPVGAQVNAIDGDEEQVYLATDGDSAYRYGSDGARTRYPTGAGGLLVADINDAAYHQPSGETWFATSSGAQVDDGSTITTYSNAALGTTSVRAVDVVSAPDGSGSWVVLATDDGLRWTTDTGGTRTWNAAFAGENVLNVAHRAPGDVWAVINEFSASDLLQLEYGTTTTTRTFPDVCPINPAGALSIGSTGDWWLGANVAGEFQVEGLCRIPAASTPGAGNVLADIFASDIDTASDGRVWVAQDAIQIEVSPTGSRGLAAYEVRETQVRTTFLDWLNAPLGTTELGTSSFEPGEGQPVWVGEYNAVGAVDERIWAGNAAGEIATVAPRWQQLDESNSLDEQVIEGIWTVRGRVFMSSTSALHVLQPDGLTWDNRAGVQANAVLGDSQGRTWVGTNDDVRLYLPSGWDTFTSTVGISPTGSINALAEDGTGRIWIGSDNGLTLYDRERFVLTLDASTSPLPADTVTTLLADRDDRLWVGTSAGLAVLESSTWITYTTADGLPNAAIVDLAETGDGLIAVSTASGLSLFDGSTFSDAAPPIPAAGLPLTVDELGRLWAGSAARTGDGWQGYYNTNSGLRHTAVSDNAADGAERVWFSHAPETGVSLRGSFLPPLANVVPTISGINPEQGSSGDLITISGSGFGNDPFALAASIGGAPVEIISATDTELEVRLTDSNTSGSVSVSYVGSTRTTFAGSGGRPAFCAQPVVSAISPTGGNIGVLVVVSGSNFDPNAEIALGSGPLRPAIGGGPTQRRAIIQADDTNGQVRVRNTTSGCPTLEAASAEEFRRIDLSLERLALNQGMPSYALVLDKPTLIQHYLTHSTAPRPQDAIEVDTVEVTFTSGGESISIVRELAGPAPSTASPLAPALATDITSSLNIWPRLNISTIFDGVLTDDIEVSSVLRRRAEVVASGTTTVGVRRDATLRVLLVPILANDYTNAELRQMRANVLANLDEARSRTWPTGEIEFYWSPQTFTVADAQIGSPDTVDISDTFDLYDASHSVDRARRWWNEHREPDVMVAFGVVDANVNTGSSTGKAFWPDISELLNLAGLSVLDTLCDIGDAAVTVLTFGLVGGDGCNLEVPLYVGWAEGDTAPTSGRTYSRLYAHEFGHIFGLVKPIAANGDFTDNFSHSVNDELDGGSCGAVGSGATYNFSKSIYRQPGVAEPVVNPLAQRQFLPQDDGNPNTRRGKALMSYACARGGENSFFEPADVIGIYYETVMSSGRTFIHELRPGASQVAAAGPAQQPAEEVPTPILVPGQRLYVSGTVNRVDTTGELRRVEPLGEDAPLDMSFESGWWLVQLNGATELSRIGVLPAFRASDQSDEEPEQVEFDDGFFAATLLLAEGANRIELRQGDTVLDSLAPGSAAPQVTISSPTGGTFTSGSVPIAWSASDADGDPLDVVIDYSTDGGTSWTAVAFGHEGNTLDLPISELAGSDNARIRVTASDGFNQGSDVSPAFSVADSPPQPYISAPLDGNTYTEGIPVPLRGGAFIPGANILPASGLRWSSDRDGDLGTGAALDVVLSVGPHVLTLEATSDAGLSASTSAVLTVRGDYDFDGILDDDELDEGLNPLTARDAFSDADGDNLPLITERERGTLPGSADTDDDGRDDDTELAGGTNPLVNDTPLPADALVVSPATLTLEADLSLGVPMPQEQIQVGSREPATWELAADVDWLAANVITGTTPAGVTILLDAFELDDGTYTGTLTFTSAALSSSETVEVTAIIRNSAAHFDVDDDGQVTCTDVAALEAQVPQTNDDDGFDFRFDINRDGVLDSEDVTRLTARVPGGTCDIDPNPSGTTLFLPLITR